MCRLTRAHLSYYGNYHHTVELHWYIIGSKNRIRAREMGHLVKAFVNNPDN